MHIPGRLKFLSLKIWTPHILQIVNLSRAKSLEDIEITLVGVDEDGFAFAMQMIREWILADLSTCRSIVVYLLSRCDCEEQIFTEKLVTKYTGKFSRREASPKNHILVVLPSFS